MVTGNPEGEAFMERSAAYRRGVQERQASGNPMTAPERQTFWQWLFGIGQDTVDKNGSGNTVEPEQQK
jgi:hypothetical protein